jgi:MFS family permease
VVRLIFIFCRTSERVPIMPTPARPTNVRWLMVALLIGIVFLAHFNRVSITVAGTSKFIGKDDPDRLSEAQAGTVYSAFLFVYTLGMLPGGWLIDRVGPRRAMTWMGLGFGLFSALTGVLGWTGMTVAAMFVPLLVVRGVAGATSVPLHPGAARAVSLWTPLRERSTANGLVTAGALVGIALCYPCFGWLMDRVGWPLAFIVSGGCLMLFAVLWWVLSADAAAGHPATNAAERDLVAPDATPARSRPTLREVGRLFLNPGMVLLALSYGAVSYVQYLFFYWIEFYFLNVLKLTPEASRGSAFVITLSMALGMAAGGLMSDRVCRRLGHRWGCRLVAFTGMGLCAGFSLLGIATANPTFITCWFSLALGSLGLCEGIFWTTAPRLEPRNGALACALLNTSGNGIGLLAPIVTPIIGQRFGWNSAIVVACVVCAAGGSLWLGIGRTPEPRPDAVEPD